MRKAAREKVVIIGCGSVAWQIARQLSRTSRFTVGIYNHAPNKALEEFNRRFRCETSPSLANVPQDGAFYFLCVPDRFIAETAEKLEIRNPSAVLIHCSGSMPLSELGERGHGTAVFYPVQSFSTSDEFIWNEVPIVLECSDRRTLARMHAMAGAFSVNVLPLKREERLLLHLCAVVVNNFPNALYAAAEELLGESKSKKLSFGLLRPLIAETTRKIRTMAPAEAQTGPAKRGDVHVIDLHLKLLKGHRTMAKVYKQMTKLIQKEKERGHGEL